MPWADSTNKEANRHLSKAMVTTEKKNKTTRGCRGHAGSQFVFMSIWQKTMTSSGDMISPKADMPKIAALLRKHDAISLISTAGRHRRAPPTPEKSLGTPDIEEQPRHLG